MAKATPPTMCGCAAAILVLVGPRKAQHGIGECGALPRLPSCALHKFVRTKPGPHTPHTKPRAPTTTRVG